MKNKHAKIIALIIIICASTVASFITASDIVANELPLTAVVDTTSGKVQGFVANGIHTFKGIRYGAPPIGKNRFLPPQKPIPATGRIDASHYGAPAMQMADNSSAEPATDFSMLLRRVFPTPSELKIDNEDCLFLNVWTPNTEDTKKRPVMVWFHGGGFAYGSGAWPIYHGENLSRRGDVVVVTVNHRLNVFGYLYLAEIFGPDYADSGNAGMLDLVLSLEWVRDNIAAFGGDPDNVTIMGESGGGFKVSLLMAMPKAKGLFHKAVVQSGPGLVSTPKEMATKITKTVLKNLGIEDPKTARERLKSVTSDELLMAAVGKSGAIRFNPVVDGSVLPRHPFTPDAPKQAENIPLLIGFNKDEMTIFQVAEPWYGKLTEEEQAKRAAAMPKGEALVAAFRKIHPDYSPTHLFTCVSSTWATNNSFLLADRKSVQQAPVYMYQLAWETPVNNGILRCPHTLEIPFMFDNVEKGRPLVGPGSEPQKMADQMSEAWIAFARTGNPGTEKLPKWPAYNTKDRAIMVFNIESKVENDPYGTIREIMLKK